MNFDAPPTWFQPALLQALTKAIAPLTIQMVRTFNSSCNRRDDVLTPVPLANGDPYPEPEGVAFPYNVSEFERLTNEEINILLQAYELPSTGTEADRRSRLARYIGLRV
eukprot:gene14008-15475_t